METILNLLNSMSVTLTIVGLLIIAFARAIVRIFRMGATFKTEFATKKEQRDFEDEIRKDMRGYAGQIQASVLNAVLNVINTKMKDVDEANKAVVDIKVMKAEIEAEFNRINEKYDEIKDTTKQIASINNKVQRLEYNNDPSTTTRRHV